MGSLAAVVAAAIGQSSMAAPAPAPPSSVASPKPVQKLDPETIAEATRLLDAEGFEQELIRSSELAVDTMSVGMVERMQKASDEQIPADFIAQLKQAMHDHAVTTMRANLASIKRQAAEIYAKEFTKAELTHMRELATDPVMVKARERRKVIEPQLMMIGIRTMRASQPELEAKIKRLVADYLAAHPRLAPKSSS